MDEKVQFIAAWLQRRETLESLASLCERFNISRPTGYKWISRYRQGGSEGLADRSRAPHSNPHAVAASTVALITDLRRKHGWGPKKLRVVFKRRFPSVDAPAISTIGEILQRRGLTRKRRRRPPASTPYEGSLASVRAPNEVWCADFKGAFGVAGQRCNPLTITDLGTRYLIRCQALSSTLSGLAVTVFKSAFREYGLPEAIRTDNGPPFSSLAVAGLSRLSVWWIRLGIRPERILPGRPDQNGAHERFHRTLKAATAKPPRASWRAQQAAFDAFGLEYNQERPHEALGQVTPGSLYTPSLRRFPAVLPEIEYPLHFKVERAYPNGVVSFRRTQWYVSGCLAKERIGFEEIETDCWKAYFGPISLGVVDLRLTKDRGPRHFGRVLRMGGRRPKRRRCIRRR